MEIVRNECVVHYLHTISGITITLARYAFRYPSKSIDLMGGGLELARKLNFFYRDEFVGNFGRYKLWR